MSMPIYEFSCLHCGNQFEQIKSYSDTTLPICPACHGHRVQRRLSPPAIHFKGSGWYVTDSKNASKTGVTGKNSGDKGESAPESGKGESDKNETGKSEQPAAPAPTTASESSTKPA